MMVLLFKDQNGFHAEVYKQDASLVRRVEEIMVTELTKAELPEEIERFKKHTRTNVRDAVEAYRTFAREMKVWDDSESMYIVEAEQFE